jgi:uncharacterized protein (DUF736 family)
MSYELNELTGNLHKTREKKSDKSPDYFGSLMVDGVEYRLAGWIAEPKNGGQKYISLKAQVKDEQRQASQDVPEGTSDNVLDSDIPF